MNIKISNLDVYLSKKKIIKDVSLEIESGKISSIIGPNGSGKSTLLKAIYRYIEDYTGDIYIDNRNLRDISSKELAKRLSVVTQFNQKGFEFTVEQIVGLGRTVHQKLMEKNKKKDYEIIDDAIRKNGLEDKRYALISNLSGGERQRVSLARAMAQGGECMILDEPSNHLDINHQLQLMRTIKTMDKTIIMALHDIELAAMYSDYIYVLEDGRLKAKGTPEEVLTKDLIMQVYGVDANVVFDNMTEHIGITYYK